MLYVVPALQIGGLFSEALQNHFSVTDGHPCLASRQTVDEAGQRGPNLV